MEKEQGVDEKRQVAVNSSRILEDLRKPIVFVVQPNGCTTAISGDFQLKGLDSKLVEMLNQRTGAYCYACDVTKQDAHKVERVQEGFTMNVSMERLEDAVENLLREHNVSDEDRDMFEFPYQPGDYEVRLGLKHTPLTSVLEVQKVIAVLHTTKLRMFGFVNELISRMTSKCLQWGKGRLPPTTKDRLLRARLEWNEDHLGTLIGYRHKQAPNQITGHLVDLFMLEANRPSVLEAIRKMKSWKSSWGRPMSDDEVEYFRNLLQRLKVIGSVVSSGQCVKVGVYTLLF